MINIEIKHFDSLTINELYSILKLRNEVFVVEQNCAYLDIDDKDQQAYHIIGCKNNKIVAYTRVFKPGDYFELSSIGRVLVSKDERKHSYGYDIMKESIKMINEKFGKSDILISAQSYLKNFYKNLGFIETENEYLEDGIPHFDMIYKY